MGSPSLKHLQQRNQQFIFQEQITEDKHAVSSVLKTHSNFYLFQISHVPAILHQQIEKDQIISKKDLRQNHKYNQCGKKQEKIQQVSTQEMTLKINEETLKVNEETLQSYNEETQALERQYPLSEIQNISQKIQNKKNQRRNSSIRINGDFLKIKEKQAVSEYKVLAKITNRHIGQLYKVLDKTTNQLRSLEIIKQDTACQETLHQINLLKKLDHPHIFHLYDVFLKKNHYYIVGQYIQGDNILCLTRKNIKISQRKISKIISQVLQALNYLHFRGIMHRNLKPQTIVFQQRINNQQKQLPSIKIVNFKKATESIIKRENVGDVQFTAPEVFIGGHNQKCDIWAVGVILYMLVIGQLPFQGQSKQKIKNEIISKDLNFEGKNQQNVSPTLVDLLESMLQKSPLKRPSAKQALSFPFFTNSLVNKKAQISKRTMRNLLCTVDDSKFKTIIKTYLVKMTTSAQERQVFAKKFQSLDRDKSGFIDKSEIMSAYKQIYGESISQEVDLDAVIRNIDINQSGLIDFSEFMASISRAQTLFSRQRLQKAFQFIDNDGTGEIEITQLLQLLRNQLQNDQTEEGDQQILEILKQFDRDGDKTISKEQFINFFLKLKDIDRRKTTIKPN